jgi:hypothetical protein
MESVRYRLPSVTKYPRLTYYMEWKLLNVIALGERESDNTNRIMIISDPLLIQSACSLVIWDLLNQGQFDPINQMKTISDHLLIQSACWLFGTYSIGDKLIPLTK